MTDLLDLPPVKRERGPRNCDQPIIRIDNVSKHFGSVQALREVSLDICAGEVVVIIGPSGSGKSTLLRCINRLEADQRGDIYVDGIHLSRDKTNINACARRWAWSSSSSTCSRT